MPEGEGQSGGSRSQGWNRVSPKPAKPLNRRLTFGDMLNTVAVTFHPDSRPSGDRRTDVSIRCA